MMPPRITAKAYIAIRASKRTNGSTAALRMGMKHFITVT